MIADAAVEQPHRGQFSMTSYILPDDLTYEEWASEGPGLIAMARASMWWLGDWIRYGESRWGDKYSQAVEETGYAVQTLQNAVWVCERVPPEERRQDLEFGHYTRLASLDSSARAEISERAATEGWTVGRTAAAVRAHKGGAQEPPDAMTAAQLAREAVALVEHADEALVGSLASGESEPVAQAHLDLGRALERLRSLERLV